MGAAGRKEGCVGGTIDSVPVNASPRDALTMTPCFQLSASDALTVTCVPRSVRVGLRRFACGSLRVFWLPSAWAVGSWAERAAKPRPLHRTELVIRAARRLKVWARRPGQMPNVLLGRVFKRAGHCG
jgi:hypothetical protein